MRSSLKAREAAPKREADFLKEILPVVLTGLLTGNSPQSPRVFLDDLF